MHVPQVPQLSGKERCAIGEKETWVKVEIRDRISLASDHAHFFEAKADACEPHVFTQIPSQEQRVVSCVMGIG